MSGHGRAARKASKGGRKAEKEKEKKDKEEKDKQEKDDKKPAVSTPTTAKKDKDKGTPAGSWHLFGSIKVH
jgi:hypothetical protein